MTPEREAEVRAIVIGLDERDLDEPDRIIIGLLATLDRERAEIDRLRALPVVPTCAHCGWCDRDDVGPVCGMAEAVGERLDDPRLPPPAWCPLRGSR